MNCILFGGSGEVGGAVARELLKSDVCSKLTMLGRRAVASMQDEAKVDQVVVDTSSPYFEEIVKEVAQAFVAHMEKRVATQNEPVVSYGNKEMKLLILETRRK